ncbi:DUF3397 domain-containing protein [Oceanobacillus sp. Castelsardo]|uniref:DUF3397 domain-containing protein n=1 Tax=Oceanobacillus sp. Castelsardo TaxID=1851204 RepID=UPI0009EED9CB|nr:DUF3397 domain-containing protein [Oceanobacillus sp. Castelsardo]
MIFINFIIYLLSFFIMVPIIATVIVYIIVLKLSRSSKKAVHIAVNWSTIFYIISTIILIQYLFNTSITGFILIFMLFVLAVIIFYQWKANVDIEIKKAFKILWKICFLLFFILYVTFSIIGIIMEIV